MVTTVGAVRLQRQRGAGLDCDAVEMDGAAAALAGVAADVRAGQPELVAQQVHQQGAVLDVERVVAGR